MQLHAEFLFIVQVILYAGGIMVLFVFVIMLVNLDVRCTRCSSTGSGWWRCCWRWCWARRLSSRVCAGPRERCIAAAGGPPASSLEPNTERWRDALFSTYMLPFEVASILLLVAMIGAVVMAKKRV